MHRLLLLTIPALLLSLILASWLSSASPANAAPNQKDSFLEVGNTYEFRLTFAGVEATRIAKVVEAPRTDGWVKCTGGVGNIWIN